MPSRSRLVAAFGAVYLIWGSTYLGIRFALETLPPFLMAGARFLLAGAILYAWGRSRAASAPTGRQWAACAAVGGFLIVGGNGAVSWAQQYVPSGIAALIGALTPCLMVLLHWATARDQPLRAPTALGIALGFAGMAVLVGPGLVFEHGVHRGGALVLMLGSLSWAVGSLYGRRAPLPSPTPLATGMQMLCGGAVLVLIGAACGELAGFEPAAISTRSALAFGYLTVFGSLLGFSAYVWLLQVSTPARISTHAYVNPLVAVALGWLLGGEPITPRILVAAALSLGGIVLIVLPDRFYAVPGPSPGSSGLRRGRSPLEPAGPEAGSRAGSESLKGTATREHG